MGYHLNFALVWQNFDRLGWGLVLSLELAMFALAAGTVIGLLLALAHVSGGRLVRAGIRGYVECVRNVPLLLLVYLVFYGIPSVIDIDYSATQSFVVTLSLYAAAYLVEVFRAGLAAIGQGMLDAGRAIGLAPGGLLVHVRLPIMIRIVLPSLGNTFVSLFKDTSIASVLAIPELSYGAQWINFNTFRIIEVYAVAAPMYVLTGYAILWGLRGLERRFRV